MIEQDFINKMKHLLDVNNLSTLADQEKLRKLYLYHSELYEVNKRMNLTAIRDEEKALHLHYIDSLLALPALPRYGKLIDIGSGGGVPAIPLTIFNDQTTCYCLDSTVKKLKFIENAAKKCQIDGRMSIMPGRAEELVNVGDNRELFDACTARAVANLRVLVELALPFLRVGGIFVALKGPLVDQEIVDASEMIRLIGGKIKEIRKYTLKSAYEDEERNVVVIEKIKSTPPKYPRPYAAIIK